MASVEYNHKLVAEDNNYHKYGGIAALIGIYPTFEGAEFIREIVRSKFPNSNLVIIKTTYPLTVKYPENFTPEKLNKK